MGARYPNNGFGGDNLGQRFRLAREQAKRDAQQGGQQQVEALQRRFASLGSTGSGQAVKLEQQARQQALGQQAANVRQIDVAELGERARQNEILQGQEFQSGEAAKQRDFAASENLLNRKFQAEEARLGREYATAEAEKARTFQRELFDVTQAFKERQFSQSNSQFAQQMDIAAKQLNLDEVNSAFNRRLARKQLGKKNLLEQFFANFKFDTGDGNTGRPGRPFRFSY